MNLEVGVRSKLKKKIISERITDSVMQIKCFKATVTLEHSTAEQKKKSKVIPPAKHN